MLSFTVTDLNGTITKLMALGAELDGPIKYEIHGKVCKAIRCCFNWYPAAFCVIDIWHGVYSV
jgi:hypothetical protein